MAELVSQGLLPPEAARSDDDPPSIRAKAQAKSKLITGLGAAVRPDTDAPHFADVAADVVFLERFVRKWEATTLEERAYVGALACVSSCCLCLLIFCLVLSASLFKFTNTAGAVATVHTDGLKEIYNSLRMPGDESRKYMAPFITKGIATNNWQEAKAAFKKCCPNAALLIGTESGIQLMINNGNIDLDGDHLVASGSKIVAVLAILRLLEQLGKTPDQVLLRDHIPSWPTSGVAASVSLAHVMAFTTGFSTADTYCDGGPPCHGLPIGAGPAVGAFCARPMVQGDRLPWSDCVDLLASFDKPHVPGTTFIYGPWHLVLAAAAAMRLAGKPLEPALWQQFIEEMVFEPAHVEAPYPKYMAYPEDGFPDFSGGLRMSGMDYQHIFDFVMFRGGLGPVMKDWLFTDHTKNVTRWLGLPGGPPNPQYGMWHYAQGSWVTCDSASQIDHDGQHLYTTDALMQAAKSKCVLTTDGGDNVAEYHSLGAFGEYSWMAPDAGYYGVFMHDLLMDAFDLIKLAAVCTALLLIAFVPMYRKLYELEFPLIVKVHSAIERCFSSGMRR